MPSIRVFGDCGIMQSGMLTRLPRQRDFAVLAMLSGANGRPLSRESIASTIWDNATPERALHSLSQSLYSLSKTIHQQLFVRSKTEIQLNADICTSDFAELYRAVESQDVDGVVEVFRGPFLETFSRSISRGFEQWEDEVKGSTYAMLDSVLRRHLQPHRQEGDWESVERIASKLLLINPFDDEALSLRLRALLLMGKRLAAVMLWKKASEEYMATLGTPPDVTFDESDVAESEEERISDVKRIPVVGRETESSLVQYELDRLEGADANVILIGGESGIGKTAMLSRLQRLGQLEGFTVVTCQCESYLRDVSYAGIGEILKSLPAGAVLGIEPVWRAALFEVFPFLDLTKHSPQLPQLSEAASQLRLLESISQVVQVHAGDSPCLLAVDNAQWLDTASLGTLAYILKEPPSNGIMLALSVRTDRGGGKNSLEDLLFNFSPHDPTVVTLDPLIPHDSSKLIKLASEHLQVTLTHEVHHRVIEQGAGNPYMLIEIVKALAAGEIVPKDQPPGTPAAIWLPRTAEQLLRGRLARLTGSAKTVMRHMAVLGAPASLNVLREITGLDNDEVAKALDQLCDSHIITDGGGLFKFRHDLLGEAAYRSILLASRNILHRKIAKYYSAPECQRAGAAAEHFLRSNDSESAYRFATMAAAETKKYQSKEKIRALRIALETVPQESDAPRIQIALASLLVQAGELSDAERLLSMAEAALTKYGPHTCALIDAKARRLQIQEALRNRRSDQLAGELEDVLIEAIELGCIESITRLLFTKAVLAHFRADYGAMRELLLQLVHHAEFVHNHSERAAAYGHAANISAHYARAEEAINYATRAVEAAAESGDVEAGISATLSYGVAALLSGRVGEARERLDQALDEAHTSGVVDLKPRLYNLRGVALLESGAIPEAEATFILANELARKIKLVKEEWVSLINLAIAKYEHGFYHEAIRLCADFDDRSGEFAAGNWTSLGLRGLAALKLHRRADARKIATDLEAAIHSIDYCSGDPLYPISFLSRMMDLEGRRDEAVQLLRRAINEIGGHHVVSRWRLQIELASRTYGKGDARLVEEVRLLRELTAKTGARLVHDLADDLYRRMLGEECRIERR